MARTIAVSDEVYGLLKKNKLPEESFSKVIKRSLKRRPKLSDIAGSGTLSKEAWKRAQAELKKSEALTTKKLEEMFE